MKILFSLLAAAAMVLSVGQVSAQEFDEADWDNLSLEQLMTIPINSASKKDETLFDAPLSSFTITRTDIDQAGSTSIMEALRLAPGVIVREQTNGSYDIHIRGFDNVLRHSETTTKANLATLVMIDNRPVFNNSLGGTFWEALPIDLNDVERIEIVRGPSAPLFGPNAVTGVINIITRKVDTGKPLVNANMQAGTESIIANISAGKSFNKFSMLVSGNYQNRVRFQNSYFVPLTGKYHSVDEMAAMFGESTYSQYRDPDMAMEKFGMNAYLNYKFSRNVNLTLTTGTQQSEVQKIFLANVVKKSIPITTNETKTAFVNLAGKVKGFSFRTSFLDGHDNLAVNAPPNQYDYVAFDALGEYTIEAGKLGTVVPGVTYQQASLSDEKYTTLGPSFLGGKNAQITTASAFIRTDLHPLKVLRVIGALRVDKFSAPDKAYLAYELAATYKMDQKNLLRAAVTKSNSGSFIGYRYLDLKVPLSATLNIVRTGSSDLEPLTINMIELGYRSQITKSFHIDLDVFRQTLQNLTALQTMNGIDPGNGTFIPTHEAFVNVPTTATQVGGTFSINFVPNDRLHIKPFVTVQRTETQNLPSSYFEPGLANTLGAPLTYSSSKHKNTPAVYGGYYIHYNITKGLNLNVNGYYFAAHRQYDQYDLTATSEAGDIQGKVVVNGKISYNFVKFNIFLNGRNLTNSVSNEFYGGDKTGRVVLGGISFTL